MPKLQLAVSGLAERPAGISSGTLRCRSGPPYRKCYCRAAVQSHVAKDRQSDLKAVVIGGGFAGLSAAAGLSRQFSKVVNLSCTAIGCLHDLRYPDPAFQCLQFDLQTLLDRDSISDPAQQPERGDSKDWQQYYDVCTVLTSSYTIAYQGSHTQ